MSRLSEQLRDATDSTGIRLCDATVPAIIRGVLKSTYPDQVCSVARALEVVGERWTLLILRDAMLGISRFEAFLERLGIARNVLADRLDHLVSEGVLVRR